MKPLISILIITATLMSIAFLQMEERRKGYSILKLTREHREIVEEKRMKSIQLAKLKRPQHIEEMAQTKLTLKKIQSHQIIHLTGAESITHEELPLVAAKEKP